MAEETRVEFACCYCGEPTDGPALALMKRDTFDLIQQWWCHEACFRKTLHPRANVVLEEMDEHVWAQLPEHVPTDQEEVRE